MTRAPASSFWRESSASRYVRAEHEAWATAATADLAATFGVSKGSPLLVIETIFFTTGDRPAGWRSAVHQAEKFKYRFSTSR